MLRRQFLATLAAGAASAAPKLPNIVYLLADDLGWGDLRAYNPDSGIPTPNADRVASQGVRFTDMHSPSAVCTPTRYGILTGRYCWRSPLKQGVLNGYSPNLIEPGRLTVPALLKSRGYYTAGVGKWHLGLGSSAKTDYSQPLRPGPLDHGFDYYYGIPASLDMPPYLYFENDRAVEQPTSDTAGSDSPRGVFWRGGPRAPGFELDQVLPMLTSKAESIIGESAGRKQPYFLYLPLTGPHTPWLPLAKWRGRSKAGDYGDFAAQVDDTIGRIARAIDNTRAETLFIVTSDNGAHWTPDDKSKFPHRANANWRGMKADAWDAGHRIPFIARWPGQIPAGSVSNDLACLTDFMATAAAVTGAKIPAGAGEDSVNLLPSFQGKAKRPPRETVVHHSSQGMFAIRDREWKLILGLGSGGFSEPRSAKAEAGGPEGQLYNLKNDPGEQNNLYLQHPEIVARLKAALR